MRIATTTCKHSAEAVYVRYVRARRKKFQFASMESDRSDLAGKRIDQLVQTPWMISGSRTG